MNKKNASINTSFELDHVFVLVSEGALEADLLIAFGLVEGSPNLHPGQGTANRRFFFHNTMLELAYVCNPEEAKSASTRPTGLWDHWRSRAQIASPFGIILRSAVGQNVANNPFKGWHYKPQYLPAHLSFLVGENANRLQEPLVFYIPFGGRPDTKKPPQPLHHSVGFQEVTSITIYMPKPDAVSDTIKSLMKIKNIAFKASNQHLMEIGFDDELSGKSKSFQPRLPLVFKW